MAKRKSVKPKQDKPQPPSSLTMSLFAPGMTILHRAGLGGLACTLKYIERAYNMGIVLEEELPGDWSEGRPPWEITEQSVTLHFGEPEKAGEFLKRLFAIAFQIKDGLIYLPGQYDREPSMAVRAALQSGLTLTFLQHGKVRTLAKTETILQYDPIGDGRSFVTVRYKRCESYKHQQGWKNLTDNQGKVTTKPVEVIGPLNPGAIVRHVAFTGRTKLVDTPDRVLPLYFALVGAIALPVNRGVGALVVPDVDDLIAFAIDRPMMTPRTVIECRIAERSDALMQAKLRLRGRGLLRDCELPSFLAVTFKPTPWASQQKSRTWSRSSRADPSVRHVEPDHPTRESRRLDQFEIALALLSPRIRAKQEKIKIGKGRNAKSIERTVSFWTDSVVRPLIADNLAQGKEWYADFTSLMRDNDANGTPYRYRLSSEREGLNTMIENVSYDQTSEKTLVLAVHAAIRSRMAQIIAETQGESDSRPTQATKNRWNRFREQLRLSLVGAKTADQCRGAICGLFGRAGSNNILRNCWEDLLPLITHETQWQKARDLALLALASYARAESEDTTSEND